MREEKCKQVDATQERAPLPVSNTSFIYLFLIGTVLIILEVFKFLYSFFFYSVFLRDIWPFEKQNKIGNANVLSQLKEENKNVTMVTKLLSRWFPKICLN